MEKTAQKDLEETQVRTDGLEYQDFRDQKVGRRNPTLRSAGLGCLCKCTVNTQPSLLSLAGRKGDQGVMGFVGLIGNPGDFGPRGPKGDRGPTGQCLVVLRQLPGGLGKQSFTLFTDGFMMMLLTPVLEILG